MLPALKQLYKEKGSLGTLEWIYDKKRFFPVKLILKSIFKLFPYESILRLTAHYNKNIPITGFTNGTKKYLSDLNIRVEQKSEFEFEGPCLIFGNHPTGLDPYIIASCLKRDDVYIVADIYQKQKGNHIGSHIIPIVYSRTRKNLDNRGFLNSIGFYIMRQFTGYENLETVRTSNKETIAEAVRLLLEGHIVIIFPDGGSNNPELWYNGIGEIIKKVSINQQKINLYAAQIIGISSLKLWLHFLGNKKKLLSEQPPQIVISPRLTLEMLCIEEKDESNEITERLRSEFKSNNLWRPNYAYRHI
jgi:1-acyl-sn-glycerol-3-phosphate acyltransferase